eukprot:3435118-Amphidinium_carterae.1
MNCKQVWALEDAYGGTAQLASSDLQQSQEVVFSVRYNMLVCTCSKMFLLLFGSRTPSTFGVTLHQKSVPKLNQ